jgi:hypothetical protein
MMPTIANRWSEPKIQAERRREIERSQAQQSEFYRRETEQQEAGQNAEAAQRLGLRSEVGLRVRQVSF